MGLNQTNIFSSLTLSLYIFLFNMAAHFSIVRRHFWPREYFFCFLSCLSHESICFPKYSCLYVRFEACVQRVLLGRITKGYTVTHPIARIIILQMLYNEFIYNRHWVWYALQLLLTIYSLFHAFAITIRYVTFDTFYWRI